LPSQAREELNTDPDRLALVILEMRAYERVKGQVDAAKTAEDIPTGALAELVQEINVDLWRKRKERRG
jgi:hypothetical protein